MAPSRECVAYIRSIGDFGLLFCFSGIASCYLPIQSMDAGTSPGIHRLTQLPLFI